MGLGRSAEEVAMTMVAGTCSRKGSTPFGRFGDVMQHPPMWGAVAGALALGGGARGRRAAGRGVVCYLAAAAAHLPIKVLVGRTHPRGAGLHQAGPFTSSFPSGHAASDLAFALGASQEIPLLMLPLSAFTTAVHWSLIRKRSHYLTDVLAGGALGLLVALVVWKLWPPTGGRPSDERSTAPEDERAGEGPALDVTAASATG